MDESEYKTLLDKAYGELPQVLYKKERFSIPEVKGRLIKSRTVINNFKDIAKQLSRDKDHLARYMLRDLGVRGEVDNREELVLHSRFQPAMLNKAVKNYFTKFVECEHCKSPDTTIDTDNLQLSCKACGHRQKIEKL